MNRCRVPDCNGITDYDDGAQAILCTTCGVVTMQDIITERDDEICGNSLYFGPTTLKSLRRVGGVLPGQSSKEDRDRRNTVAMHQYISGLLNKLACSGLAPRAHSLFNQARVHGAYRWGKKAVLAAGACIAVTLRESKKGIMISHLATLMDVSPHSLCRMFTDICTLLGLQVPAFDPVALLPDLQSHLKALMSDQSCPLPQAIVKLIQPLPPAQVLQLATSLAILVNHVDKVTSPGVQASAMACALLILALEGQAVSSLPSYVLLAQELGKKVGAHKNLVIGQYRDIRKIVEEWMKDVPWILTADHSDNKLGKKRRKTSQRDAIAMAIKDVVQFREDILKARKEKESMRPITASLELAEEDEDWEQSTESSETAESSTQATGQKRKRIEPTEIGASKLSRVTRSQRAKPLTRLDLASLALLSPSHPLASIRVQRPVLVSEVDDIQTQILASTAFPTGVPPTRLQRLTTMRGSEREIEDDELFERGELEGFLRSDDEVVKLRAFLEWNSPEQNADTRPGLCLPQDADMADLETWAEFGGDKDGNHSDAIDDIGTQVLGEWRAASPSDGLEVGDLFDTHAEW